MDVEWCEIDLPGIGMFLEVCSEQESDLKNDPLVTSERGGCHDDFSVDQLRVGRAFTERREVGHGLLPPGGFNGCQHRENR